MVATGPDGLENVGMRTATLATVGRPPAELSAEDRARIRRAAGRRETAARKLADADRDLSATVRDVIDAGGPPAAVARELGISRQALYERLKAIR